MESCTLLPHQVADASKLLSLLNSNGSACDRSEMGTGKSYTAASVARDLGLTTIVICPKATIPQWSHVLSLFLFPGPNPRTVTNYESVRLGKLKGYYTPKGDRKAGGTFGGWSKDKPLLIIFDEAHRLRNRTSQQTRILRHAREAGHKILLLSATLATNALDLSVIGYALGLFLDSRSWWHWAKRYGGFLNRWGGYDCSTNFRHLTGINRTLDTKGVRTTIMDLGQDLPCVTVPELVRFERTEHINKEFEVLQAKLTGEPGADLAYRVSCRQFVELHKAKHFINEAEDLVDQGYSVVIFVNFTDTLDYLAGHLTKHELSLIYGGQTEYLRQAAIDAFVTNKTKILVTNIKAGGIGLSLHDTDGNHPRVSLISPPESAIDLIQCLGRIRRVGMRSPAVNRILFAAESIEERVFRNVSRKVKCIETINDGDLDPAILQ